MRPSRIFFATVAAAAAVTVFAAPALAGGSDWKVGYYTPSGQTLSTGSADVPSAGLATFNFTNQPNTALLITTKGNSPYLGDLTGKAITATFEITGVEGQFIYGGEPSCGSTTSYIRLFFQTSNAGGFDETHYWWSNPVHYDLANTEGPVALTQSIGDGAGWSDYFGHFGNDPNYSAGFNAAAADVTMIGLSFGGGCFFENGVGTTDGSGTFALNSFATS